jgi:hypothetical protein
MNATKGMTQQIIETTEVRQHNGQCAYGAWEPLEESYLHVQAAIADEILACMTRDMRRESSANTDESGTVEIGGQRWVYRR